MTEAALKHAAFRWLKSEGIWYMKLHGSMYMPVGMPDTLILLPVTYQEYAIPLFIELKMAGKNLTPSQIHRQEVLIHAGAAASVARTLGDVQRIVTALRGK